MISVPNSKRELLVYYANENMRERYPEVGYTDPAAVVLEEANGVIVVTDRGEFGALDSEFDAIADPVMVDRRGILDR